MVLLALSASFLTVPTLPHWAYTYELPTRPTTFTRGVIQPADGTFPNGLPVAPSSGTGAESSLPPLRLSDLVPGLAKENGFGLGERLSRAYIDRAEKDPDGPTFVTGEGPAQVGYNLDATNRIQWAIYTVTVSPEESEARFAAIRARLDRQLGPPSYGRREGDESLTLVWQRPDGTSSSLGITVQTGSLGMGVALAGRDLFTKPIPSRKG
ncbi:hypothetical protein EON79_21280 [bacterium]|nr:MAG: hypothetical protein EON79_21280 [bacterium]